MFFAEVSRRRVWEVQKPKARTTRALFRGPGSRALAETEGFEPSIQLLTVYTLSRRAPSTTRPYLHLCTRPVGSNVDYRERRLSPTPHPVILIFKPTVRGLVSTMRRGHGGGGIRTPETLVWRFSRPLPSTTRPLLHPEQLRDESPGCFEALRVGLSRPKSGAEPKPQVPRTQALASAPRQSTI